VKGLTSINEPSSYEELPNRLTPAQKAEIHLATLNADERFLENKKEKLIEDITHLAESIAETKKALGVDISQLKRQKQLLLDEIAEFGELIVTLGKNRDAFVEGYKQFGDERIGTVKNTISPLTAKVDEDATRLAQNIQNLGRWDKFLTDFADYFTAYADIFETLEDSVVSREKQLTARADIITKSEETTRKATALVDRKVAEVLVAHKEASGGLKEARRLQKVAEKRLDDVNLRASLSDTALSLREKKLLATLRTIDVEKKRLFELKRLVEDKDAALNRKAKELKLVV